MYWSTGLEWQTHCAPLCRQVQETLWLHIHNICSRIPGPWCPRVHLTLHIHVRSMIRCTFGLVQMNPVLQVKSVLF